MILSVFGSSEPCGRTSFPLPWWVEWALNHPRNLYLRELFVTYRWSGPCDPGWSCQLSAKRQRRPGMGRVPAHEAQQMETSAAVRKHVSQKLYEREFVQLHSCHTEKSLLWIKFMFWVWDWHPLTWNQKLQISITGCGSRFPRSGSVIAFSCIFINHISTNLHIKKNLHSKVPQKWRVLYHFLPGLL